MAKVFIVVGETGEYSDRYSWFVRAFLSEAASGKFCDRLNLAAKEAGIDVDGGDYATRDARTAQLRTVDPLARCDYTGVSYSVDSCELEESR